jgi:hypothetical protein
MSTETSDADRLTSEQEEKAAERALLRAVYIGCAVAIPICVAIWVGMVELAT